MITYNIYTDGGCRNNGKENALGAWAFVILDDNYHLIDAKANAIIKNPTNIRAEMLAIINAFNYLCTKHNFNNLDIFDINIYTDSKFICDCINLKWINNWQKHNWKKRNKESVLNQDLWKILLSYLYIFPNTTFNFVKGHNNNHYNELCDQLVNNVMNLWRK